jgi:DNA processing protein
VSLTDSHYWLGLHLVQHIGSLRLQHLVDVFGSAKAVWDAPEYRLREANLPDAALNQLLKTRTSLHLEQEYEKVTQAGAHLLTLADPDYPDLLRDIHDPPPVLYVRGSLLMTDNLALAIVGTRRATRYGKDVSHRMALWLARQDVTIISGMAHGIDENAHRGALDAGGRTIAVMGCGIDIVYPSGSEKLADAIADNGAIVSEFPIGTPPTGNNFPRRNRIISGLSLGVMVAEAPERSGALITVESALEQGRDVFAIPANIFNPIGTGCNKLIQDGAKLVMRANDVLDELNISYSRQQTRTHTEAIAPDSELEAVILDYLDAEPIHIDELIRLSGLSTSDVTATLTLLQLKGLAETAGPMQYCRAR